MKTKQILTLILSVILAIGMAAVFSACSDTASQGGDQETAVAEDESGSDGEAAEQQEITSEVVENINECVELAGEYQDEVSQRASATVIADTESRNVNITVIWTGSASDASQWTMNATKEGNKLVYSDCVKTKQIISEDLDEEGDGDEDGMGGGAEETVEYEGGSGSFEISDDGKLLWTGASDADCQSCVFVKVE